jgi:mRNA-degrading endonuclease RelE of RelBE toxin-antitoxin system
MNEFEVEASEEAEHQLARIWISAGADRSAVVAAQHDAERKLAANPTKAGRHVAEGLYRLDVPPLVVYYTILRAERIVRITEIHYRLSGPR